MSNRSQLDHLSTRQGANKIVNKCATVPSRLTSCKYTSCNAVTQFVQKPLLCAKTSFEMSNAVLQVESLRLALSEEQTLGRACFTFHQLMYVVLSQALILASAASDKAFEGVCNIKTNLPYLSACTSLKAYSCRCICNNWHDASNSPSAGMYRIRAGKIKCKMHAPCCPPWHTIAKRLLPATHSHQVCQTHGHQLLKELV